MSFLKKQRRTNKQKQNTRQSTRSTLDFRDSFTGESVRRPQRPTRRCARRPSSKKKVAIVRARACVCARHRRRCCRMLSAVGESAKATVKTTIRRQNKRRRESTNKTHKTQNTQARATKTQTSNKRRKRRRREEEKIQRRPT